MLNNLTANEFIDSAVDYLKEKANVSGVEIIKSNSDQSKHLEKATLCV